MNGYRDINPRHTPSRYEKGRLRLTAGILLIVLSLVFTLWSCDSAANLEEDLLGTEIRLEFVEPVVLQNDEPGKRERSFAPDADYTVELHVLDTSGEDFGPESFTVSDTEPSTRLTLPLPAGETYRMTVTYRRGNTSAAVGEALHYVSRETKDVTIPIVTFSPGAATVGFVPLLARIGAEEAGVLSLQLRYYAGNSAISGLACKLDVDGIDPSMLSFEGADHFMMDDGKIGLSWTFNTPRDTDGPLGTLQVPLSAAGSFDLEFASGNLRSVDANGSITRLEAVGASVEILP